MEAEEWLMVQQEKGGTVGLEEGGQEESSASTFPRKLAAIQGMMLSPCQVEARLGTPSKRLLRSV